MINCSNHYKYCRNEDISNFPKVKVFYPEGVIPQDKKYRLEGPYATIESQYDFNYDGLYGLLVYKRPRLKQIEEIIKTVWQFIYIYLKPHILLLTEAVITYARRTSSLTYLVLYLIMGTLVTIVAEFVSWQPLVWYGYQLNYWLGSRRTD